MAEPTRDGDGGGWALLRPHGVPYEGEGYELIEEQGRSGVVGIRVCLMPCARHSDQRRKGRPRIRLSYPVGCALSEQPGVLKRYCSRRRLPGEWIGLPGLRGLRRPQGGTSSYSRAMPFGASRIGRKPIPTARRSA